MPDKERRTEAGPRGEVGAIQFSESLTLTKRLSKSGGSVCLQIPKEIVETLGLDSRSLVEIKIRKVVGVRIQPSSYVGT